MGSDMYMNPPKWIPPKYRSHWKGEGTLVIEKFPGFYDAPHPSMDWEVVFEEFLTRSQLGTLEKILDVLNMSQILPRTLFN